MDTKLSATEMGLGRWNKHRRNVKHGLNESDDFDSKGEPIRERGPALGRMRLKSIDGTETVISNYDEAGNYTPVDFKAEKEKFLAEEKLKKDKLPK